MIRTTENISKEIHDLYNFGIKPGESIGYETFKGKYTVLKGTTTFYAGYSSHGKSTLIFNFLRNLTESKGWKHGVISPETGKPNRVLSKFIQLHSGKSLNKENENAISESELGRYIAELSDKYFIIDLDEKNITVDKWLEAGKELVYEHGIDTLTLDPWNEFNHNFSEYNGREDLYLEAQLGRIRRFAEDHNIHINIANHPTSDRSRGRGMYMPPCTLYDFKGGDSWANRAMNVLSYYRPQQDDEGREFPKHNKAEIHILKVKPEEVGERDVVPLWYDSKNGRLYEKIEGMDKYYGEDKKPVKVDLASKIVPNVKFDDPF